MVREKTVAILRADHIGDIVLTTPLIRALGKAGWFVDVIAPNHGVLLEGNPWVRHVKSLQTICPKWPNDWWRLSTALRCERYTALLIPFAHPRQLLAASFFSGVKERIAMWGGVPARLSGHRCRRSDYFSLPRPYAETIQRCLEPLGIRPDGVQPEIYLSLAEKAEAVSLIRQHLIEDSVCVGIHPFSFGNACNLPLPTYRELAVKILSTTSTNVVVTGSRDDSFLLNEWQELAYQFPGRIWLCAGMVSLRGLAAIISQLAVYVVPSTGPLHIATALEVKTVSPFCPQIPICPIIWGHPPLELSCVTPTSPVCDPGALHRSNCDFKGSITSNDLLERVYQRLEENISR